MADEIERLLVRIEANAVQFENQMKKVNRAMYGAAATNQRALDRIRRDWQRSGREVADSFRPVQFAAQVAFAAITAYSIKAAADAAEIRNAFEVAFGASTEAARTFADELAERVGRSSTRVQEGMTRLRLVLDGLGVSGDKALEIVTALTTRGVDIGSLFNVEDAEAFRAIISGISGETEPMKRFGVVVNQAAVEAELLRLGFEGNVTEASEAAKAIARANIIIQRTAVANGDAARTAESAANQFKRAKDEFFETAIVLGNQLLPAVTSVTRATTDAIKAFADLPSGVQIAGLAMLGLAAASGPIAAVITALSRLVRWAGTARNALAGLGLASGGSAAAGVAGLGGAAVGAGAAVLGPLAVSGSSERPNLSPTEARQRNAQQQAQLRRQIANAEGEQRRRLEGLLASAERAARAMATADAQLESAAMAAAGADTSNPLAGLGGFSLEGIDTRAPGGSGRGGGGRGASGPSEEDVRRAEEEAAAYAKEKRDQAEILAIENQRVELAKQKEESENATADRIMREADAARDRLYMERELARLSGDDEALRAAESRLWVEERIVELMRLKPDLIEAEARAMAEVEDARLAEALRTGEARSAFRSIFVEAADDLDSALLNVADRFKQRLLENLADQLFDIFANASKGMGGGGGWLSAFTSLFSKGFASGGYTGSGARMQPAGIVHKGEVVWSQSDIARAGGVAAVESMRRGMGSGGGVSRKVIEYHVTVSPEKDSFIRLAGDVAAPMAAQAGVAAAQTASATIPRQMNRRSNQRLGRR